MELVLHFGNASCSSSAMADVQVEGAMLEGAAWNAEVGAMELSEELSCALPRCYLRWSHKSQRESVAATTAGQVLVEFPLYLTSQRTVLVSEVLVAVPTTLPKYTWAQRGVAVVFQSSL